MSSRPEYLVDDDEIVAKFASNFATVASVQGRIAYLCMSIHICSPDLFTYITSYDPERFLYTNMVYGMTFMIISRPNMRPIGFVNKLIFSLLGSLMFNYSSMALWKYVRDCLPDKPRIATLCCFLCGRFMMLHLLAFLYHIDIRSKERNVPRNSAFDSMYVSS